MPTASPPYDRAIALPCRMSVFRERWLYVACRCGQSTGQPVLLMLKNDSGLGARTLAEAVIRLRCTKCGERPSRVHLAEDGRGPNVGGGAPAGWALLLHADAGARSPP